MGEYETKEYDRIKNLEQNMYKKSASSDIKLISFSSRNIQNKDLCELSKQFQDNIFQLNEEMLFEENSDLLPTKYVKSIVE